MILTLLFCFTANAQWSAQNEAIWNTHAQQWIELKDFTLQPEDILVLGETHATTEMLKDPQTIIHHANQVRLLQHLTKARTGSVSVGMEFLTYTLQAFVDQFLAGALSEVDFLKDVHWGKNPFPFYREQILAPVKSGGHTLALNIPMSIANHIARSGKDSLDSVERGLLPPVWERGNDAYFERFSAAMGGHAPEDALENYFWAQSLWDDTMGWQAMQYRTTHRNDVLVIIVGEFHVQFGGGLPYEMIHQGQKGVKTMVQIEAADWSQDTLGNLVKPDPKYGALADYIWVHYGAVPSY